MAITEQEPTSYELSLTVTVETPTFQGAKLEGTVTLTGKWLNSPSRYTRDQTLCHIAEMMMANIHVKDPSEGKALLAEAATFILTSDLGPQIKSYPDWPVTATLKLRPEEGRECDWFILIGDGDDYLARETTAKVPIFATQAAIDAFGDPGVIEEYAKQTAAELSAGETVGWICEDQKGAEVTIDTNLLHDRIIVSVRDDPDRRAKCVHCLTGTPHNHTVPPLALEIGEIVDGQNRVIDLALIRKRWRTIH